MIVIPRNEFEDLVNRAIAQLPKPYLSKIKNVAIIVDDVPSLEQRRQLMLRDDQSLFGLYEGVPLSQRQGMLKTLPDKITLFQKPLEYSSNSMPELFDHIGRTIWHEVAHYFGLNHDKIRELESKEKRNKTK
jgi:predicted Zn-dependent protease with MMP-like domain